MPDYSDTVCCGSETEHCIVVGKVPAVENEDATIRQFHQRDGRHGRAAHPIGKSGAEAECPGRWVVELGLKRIVVVASDEPHAAVI